MSRGLLVTFAGDRVGDVDLNNSSKTTIAFAGGMTLTEVADNFNIETMTDTKNVKLNSRNYGTSTSGDRAAVQIKPQITMATQGITALEVSPRFADGIAGSKLVGIMSNPDLKGSSGNLSSVVRCYEAKFDGGTGRTVDAGYILDCMHGNAATMTNGIFVIGISAAGGGGTGWTGFIRARASGAGGVFTGNMTQDPLNSPGSHPEAGYIKVYVGSTQYQMPFFSI